jgi:hypothetical protein
MYFELILVGHSNMQAWRFGMQYRIDGGSQPPLRRRERTRYSRFAIRTDTGEKCGSPSRRVPQDAFRSPFADSGTGWRSAPANHPLEALELDFTSAEQDSGDGAWNPSGHP